MPLIEIKEVGKQGKLGLWSISESAADLLKLKKFTEEDLTGLNSFSQEQRKKEWLAARILAERLTGEKKTSILYDANNKPFISGSKRHISISHSHGLLAVILDASETGIDIELVSAKIEKIKHKFMSEDELNALSTEQHQEQLTVYWCAKEALYKLYGKKELEFKRDTMIEPFQYSAKGIIRGWIKNSLMNKRFSLKYEKINHDGDQYMLVYVTQ